jgi:hypothetical protein
VTRVGIATRVLVLAAVVAVLGGSSIAHTSAFGPPLQTAVVDPFAFSDAAGIDTAYAHVLAAGASVVRLCAPLDSIAPGGTTKPPSFDPTDPADPGYDWSSVDREVTRAVAAGLEPILCLQGLPAWARDPAGPGYTRPSAAWFGKFAQGAARRYSGSFGSLPRVRFWQAWNEPNLAPNLVPTQSGSMLVAPRLYRRLVNAFTDAVKRVHADNTVIAGSLAPYEAPASDGGIPPLTFMKEFLCLSGMQVRPRPQCLERVNFDIWAMQPYTWGGPTHHSSQPGDVQLGDLPSMKQTLDEAVAKGRIVSGQQVRFWVTEFSWDSNPPDPQGLAPDLQTRWVSHALYTMWQNGVSLVAWWLIRDRPPSERWQSGLYASGATVADDAPKPTFQAFRFPMVAFVEAGGGVRVWCRTPAGAPGDVVFEQRQGSGPWTPVATVASDANGIVTSLLSPSSTQGEMRAKLVATGEESLPFSLTEVPDQPVNPFGS